MVGAWQALEGEEEEEDTLADVEERLLRRQARERYQLWVGALARGDHKRVVAGVLQCVAVCCSVLQCVALCRSVLQCVAVYHMCRNAPRL